MVEQAEFPAAGWFKISVQEQQKISLSSSYTSTHSHYLWSLFFFFSVVSVIVAIPVKGIEKKHLKPVWNLPGFKAKSWHW